MKAMTRSIFVFSLMLLIQSCSSLGQTFGEVSDRHDSLIYAGTKASSENLTGNHLYSADGWEKIFYPVFWLIYAVDFPFTMMMDTALLPYTIPETNSRRQEAGREKAK